MIGMHSPAMAYPAYKELSSVSDVCRKLGIDISTAEGWDGLTRHCIRINDRNEGHLVKAAREAAGTLSTGEMPVLFSFLHAADFSWLADELSAGQTWRMLDRTYGPHAMAVALAILRQD